MEGVMWYLEGGGLWGMWGTQGGHSTVRSPEDVSGGVLCGVVGPVVQGRLGAVWHVFRFAFFYLPPLGKTLVRRVIPFLGMAGTLCPPRCEAVPHGCPQAPDVPVTWCVACPCS